MISYVKRRNVNVEKYNLCVENSPQSKVFAFSWYLDMAVEKWDVLVLDDYRAVMPIPIRKKYGIKYVYPPFWILELGIFSLLDNLDFNLFLKELFSRFRFVELKMNSKNYLENKKYFTENKFQTILLKNEYHSIFSKYRKDRKKDCNKAKRYGLVEKWNDNPENLIHLLKNNVGKRVQNLSAKDYENLSAIIKTCLEKKYGEILSIYDPSGHLVSSGFFLKNKSTITILVSSTDFDNRNNGANTFLIDRAIYKFHKDYNELNFGGSSIESIAKYFLSFGSESKVYNTIFRRFF